MRNGPAPVPENYSPAILEIRERDLRQRLRAQAGLAWFVDPGLEVAAPYVFERAPKRPLVQRLLSRLLGCRQCGSLRRRVHFCPDCGARCASATKVVNWLRDQQVIENHRRSLTDAARAGKDKGGLVIDRRIDYRMDGTAELTETRLLTDEQAIRALDSTYSSVTYW